MIRTLLVDDEALARRGMRQMLAAHADVEVVGECRDGRGALSALGELQPDLVFLDIQMPELDGFAMLREAAAREGGETLPLVVFLTAFEEFALDAFGVEAVDYLVKPVTEQRFDEAMRRVRRRLALPRGGGEADAVAGTVPRAANHLVVGTTHGQRIIPLDDVEWIAAEDYYVAVYVEGRRHLLRESMASLEARLDRGRFVRVHRGAIVNIGRVREVRTAGGDAVVVLRDGTRLPVSRRRRSALQAALAEIGV
ncbi:MAG TPA: LytTR family transcriptional regulator DNA-binding domain-containing protein [Gemmatimonadaceae bacterium]|nr:LytTR family transcriptional regulator DNA-binding domain-containing protein [Gemmatimonadaceae bacterium]